MDHDIFLVFGLGFFLFAAYLCMFENRRHEARKDRRDDIAYQRMLNERREFGYKTVAKEYRSRPFWRK